MYGHELTAKDLTRELTWAIEADYTRPLMIWGAPGLGQNPHHRTGSERDGPRAQGLPHLRQVTCRNQRRSRS